MQQISLPLQKRQRKLVIFLFGAVLISIILFALIGGMTQSFSFLMLPFVFIFAVAAYTIFKGILSYFMYNSLIIKGESDGKTLQFFIVNDKGNEIHRSGIYNLSDYKKFSVARKTLGFGIIEHSFELEGIADNTLTRLPIFPALWGPSETTLVAITGFVKTHSPSIEILN